MPPVGSPLIGPQRSVGAAERLRCSLVTSHREDTIDARINLAHRFASLATTARELAERYSGDEHDLLQSTTASAVEQIPGASWAGITLITKRAVTSVAPTDPIAARADQLQQTAGDGPGVWAATQHGQHVARVDDYSAEDRWPDYITAAIADTPVRSTLAFSLYRSNTSMGALSVHSDQPRAFTQEAEEVGVAVATHAALALYATRQETQFASALASRDTIGQAKGMIMERFGIDALQAWHLIRQLSQDDNIPVHILAQQLIDAGRADPPPV